MSRPGPRADGGWAGPPRAHILNPAKVEIERLRQRVRVLAGEASRLREFIQGQTLTCDALSADAEIGRMVRKMRSNTRFTKHGESYSAQILAKHEGGWHRADHPFSFDPAEALRSIQASE